MRIDFDSLYYTWFEQLVGEKGSLMGDPRAPESGGWNWLWTSSSLSLVQRPLASLYSRSIRAAHSANKSCPPSFPTAFASQELEPLTRHPSPLPLTQPPTAAIRALLSSCCSRIHTSWPSSLRTSNAIAWPCRPRNCVNAAVTCKCAVTASKSGGLPDEVRCCRRM